MAEWVHIGILFADPVLAQWWVIIGAAGWTVAAPETLLACVMSPSAGAGASPDVAGVGEGAAQAAVDGVVRRRRVGHLEDVHVVADRRVAVELILRGVAVHHQVL